MRGREFWVSKVAEYERSELTQESFAQQRGIAVSTLRWWISKLRQERRSSVSLVPVRVITSTAPTARNTADADRAIEIEIELKTGVRLRVTTDAALDYVVALAQRLG
jgi:transposase-like protein